MSNDSASVGIIGVGVMGMAVCRRLLQAGYTPRVRDIIAARELQAREAGAQIASSPAALAAACAIVVTLVVDDKQNEEILFGPDGAIHTLRAGSVVVLCSTVAPAYVAGASQRLAARGVLLLDAPISGGPLRALSGEISMMLAGPAQAYARCAELLAAMSNKIFRIGECAGDGAKMKLINNVLAAANLAAGCEALALGARLGLDAKLMLEVIGASSGASWVVPERMARALAGDYAPRAATTLLAKDAGLFLQLARDARFTAPVAAAAHAAFARAVECGFGAQDDAALFQYYLQSARA
jgi:3-hydroxyisobutyrate dehydrogenase